MPAKQKDARQPSAAADEQANRCSCGHHLGCDDGNQHDNSGSRNDAVGASIGTADSVTGSSSRGTNPTRPLDASFVQVPQHDYSTDRSAQQLHQEEQQKHGADARCSGKAESYRRLVRLQQAANYSKTSEGGSLAPPPPPPALCLYCIHRVEQALDADTERMYAERHAYREAVRDDKARIKGWRQAVQGFQPAGGTPHPSSGNNNSNNEEGEEVLSPANSRDSLVASLPEQQSSMEDAFRNEIALLEEACQQHREELLNFRDLQWEQKRLELELDRVHEAMAHEQNALELEARAFDNNQEQLSRALLEIQDEVERLTSPKLKLPATLLHLQVDRERGLRYPLINELRLAYRPKGDVQWNEIQAAWALAAQLLLSIGTIFQFQSCDWKLVPLSHCAKLFYYPPTRRNNNNDNTGSHTATKSSNDTTSKPVVVNLGHPKTNHQNKALLTWNALLCQVTQHVSSELAMAVELGILDAEEVPPVPFEITPTKIGNTSLTQLKEDDDGSWSRVIHFMASDLLWLSDCASAFVRQQVVLENQTAKVPATAVSEGN